MCFNIDPSIDLYLIWNFAHYSVASRVQQRVARSWPNAATLQRRLTSTRRSSFGGSATADRSHFRSSKSTSNGRNCCSPPLPLPRRSPEVNFNKIVVKISLRFWQQNEVINAFKIKIKFCEIVTRSSSSCRERNRSCGPMKIIWLIRCHKTHFKIVIIDNNNNYYIVIDD